MLNLMLTFPQMHCARFGYFIDSGKAQSHILKVTRSEHKTSNSGFFVVWKVILDSDFIRLHRNIWQHCLHYLSRAAVMTLPSPYQYMLLNGWQYVPVNKPIQIKALLLSFSPLIPGQEHLMCHVQGMTFRDSREL